jgi:hypothetical protein
MSGNQVFILSAMLVALVRVLLPPWNVRERTYDWTFEPEHAGAWAFIASPPNKTRPDGVGLAVARVDLSRLLFQFVALSLMRGATVTVAKVWQKG